MKSFVRTLGIVGICLFLSTTVVLAETKYYINDSMKITMRTGPATDRKIIALLSVGQEVEILKAENEWTLVRLTNGKEGWVISRFLTDQTPDSIQLEALRKNHSMLQTKAESLMEENQALKAENKKLSIDLNSSETKQRDLSKSYDTLKRESKQFLDLQAKYKESTSKLAAQTQKAEKYEDELTKLLWSKNIKWFLSGAGVLVLGFIIGFSTKRQRRHSSLL
ncbi:MAG: TIGR04211 family SH3 domain-containing protein [Deltaproteobacteria bacterium]|jgi:SH3 domain protein|nr:TIGR04211 family SH3 domain-containing protein [Deltaproteobacteria bacterium]MBW2490984.1 TIGR04211 family SH3 domain-containing protein [Deltaproteobacteria bacterium]